MQAFRSTTISLFVLAVFLFATVAVSAQPTGAAILARDEPAEAAGGASGAGSKAFGGTTGITKSSAKSARSGKASATKTTPKTTVAVKPKPWNGFVVGDKYTFLNFEVVSAEKPYHTREAKANGAAGLVQVEVLIDTNGSVIQAKARTGNKLLHPEAERAALASKFNKPAFGGKPARAIGFLVYRFGPAED
jgi:hypothetical protein